MSNETNLDDACEVTETGPYHKCFHRNDDEEDIIRRSSHHHIGKGSKQQQAETTMMTDVGKLRSLLWVVTLALAVSLLLNVALLSSLQKTRITTTSTSAATTISAMMDFDDTPTTNSYNNERRQLAAAPAGGVTDTGAVAATVTVTVDGMTYHGTKPGDNATVIPTIRIERGCGVYEHLRQDGKNGKVTCCGNGDCLLGFLTQHQWLLSWL